MSEAIYHSHEAEQAIIAATMRPDAARLLVIERADLEPEHFFDPKRQIIWRAILALRQSNKLVDEVAVVNSIVSQPGAVSIEWTACLVAFGVTGLTEHYAGIIRQHALARRVLATVGETIARHRAGETEGDELLSSTLAALQALARNSHKGRTLSMRHLLKARMEELDKQHQALLAGAVPLTGVPTGLADLDKFTGGIQRGIVTLIAARPGMGKSALAQTVTAHALDQGFGVHVFSLEDRWQSYVDRMLSRKTGIPATRIRKAAFQGNDMARLTGQAGHLAAWNRFGYEDVESATAAEVIGAARRERDNLETTMVVVDYITMLKKPRGARSQQEAVRDNITQLALAARHDDMAYLVLAQLNRKVEDRNDKRPMLADLRDAGELEERAKTVLGVYRESYYNDSASDPDAMEILVLKNNDGPKNVRVECRWDGPCTRVH